MNNEAYIKDYITDSLLSLIKTSTLDKITITDIIKKAGVSRVSFYRNFASKEDILDKYLTNVTDNFIKSSNISFKKDSLEPYFITLFTHLENHKNFAYSLYKSNCLYLIENQFRRIFYVKNPEYDNYKKEFYVGGIFNIYRYWLINGCKETSEEISKKLIDLLKK